MVFDIERETEHKTTDCSKDFDCLTNKKTYYLHNK